MSESAPLIGREQEVGLAETLLGSGRALVLGGHAGVGKTRLAHAVAQRWSGPTEWISGAAGSSAIPFGATLRLLADIGTEVDLARAGGREMDVIRGAIVAARRRPERLVVVDDCHQLDEHSALLVHHLVLDRSAPLVLTVRTGEPTPPAITTLWTDHHADRLDVMPLSAGESHALSSLFLGGDVDESTATALHESSSGNPLLLRELVMDATESGSLHLVDEVWRWDGRLGRARHLGEAISGRLAELGAPGRRAILVLALAEPVGSALVGRLVPELDLDDAERRGLITVRADGRRRETRLGHPIFGEVLVAESSVDDLAGLRRELADTIAAAGGRRRDDLLLRSVLRLDAGAVDPELFTAAAAHALLLGAATTALRLAEAASASGGSPTAELHRGAALSIAHREAEAIDVLEAALPRLDNDADRVHAALSLQNIYHQREDAAAKVADLNARASTLIADPVWSAVLEGNDIQFEMMSGRTRSATRRAEALLADNDDALVQLRLVGSVGIGRAIRGELGDAFAFVADMLPVALAHRSELPFAPAWVMNAQGMSLFLSGRIADAENLVAMLTAMGSQGAVPDSTATGEAWINLFAGRVALARGFAPAACERLRSAADAFGDDDIGGWYRWARSAEAEALALQGDVPRARAVAAAAAASRSRMLVFDGEAERSRLWVDALGGEITRAIDGLLHVAALQAFEGQHALEIHTLHAAVRLGALTEAGGRLIVAAGAVEGQWSHAFTRHVEALRSAGGADLEDAGDAFMAMGANLCAAEAYADAARAFDARALRTRSAGAARRRDEALAECGEVRTPALQDVVARVGLTRREREVVELAQQGATNREIADRLFVSVRTVEGHLYRAMTKLGVTDRAELGVVVP